MEHLRIGDIVVELRTSYGASAGSEVKIKTLSIHGAPDTPSVTMELRLVRAAEKEEEDRPGREPFQGAGISVHADEVSAATVSFNPSAEVRDDYLEELDKADLGTHTSTPVLYKEALVGVSLSDEADADDVSDEAGTDEADDADDDGRGNS